MLARLVVVWHSVENADGPMPPLVTADTVQRAGDFFHKFLLRHSFAFYSGTLGLSDDHDRLTAVAGYILAHRLTAITYRDVQRGDRTMRKLDRRETTRILEQLKRSDGCIRQRRGRPARPIGL